MILLSSTIISPDSSSLDYYGTCLDSLCNKLDLVEAKTAMLSDIVGVANGSIANQIASINLLLVILGGLIAIGGTVLSVFINKKKNIIEELSKTVDQRKKEVEKMAEATKQLNEEINGNIGTLYSRLQKEETMAMLDRLVFEPEDVFNLSERLLSRELDEECFVKLREAFYQYERNKTVEGRPQEERNIKEVIYSLLFLQHYAKDALLDEVIRPVLVDCFKPTIELSFKRDIVKSTIDICSALSDPTVTFNKEDVLVEFLTALNESSHKNLPELRNILEQNILSPALLPNAIERCRINKVYLTLFGISEPGGNEIG